jgi:hypothetical protein
MKKEIWLMLALALGLRLIAINQSIWLDESISINVARDLDWKEILSTFSIHDFHPPLYYLMLRSWGLVFGFGVVTMRMPSVIFGLITVLVVAKMKQKSGWLMAVNPVLIYYSQEARMYSLVVMCLTFSFFYFEKIIKKNNRKDLFFYNLFSGLAILSFYGSIFFLGAIGIFWLWKKKYKLAVVTNIGLLTGLLILIPLLREQLASAQEMLLVNSGWAGALGKVNIKNILLIPLKFSIGRVSFYPKKLYWLLAGGWTMIVMLNFDWKKNKRWLGLGFLSLCLGMLVSFKMPMMQYFRFLYLVPVMILCLKYKKYLVVGFLLWSLAYLLMPQFHRENWKELSTIIDGEVWMVADKSDPIKYYRPEIIIRDLSQEEPERKTIEVVPYSSEIVGLDYEIKLKNGGYEKVKAIDFRQLEWQEWERKEN